MATGGDGEEGFAEEKVAQGCWHGQKTDCGPPCRHGLMLGSCVKERTATTIAIPPLRWIR